MSSIDCKELLEALFESDTSVMERLEKAEKENAMLKEQLEAESAMVKKLKGEVVAVKKQAMEKVFLARLEHEKEERRHEEEKSALEEEKKELQARLTKTATYLTQMVHTFFLEKLEAEKLQREDQERTAQERDTFMRDLLEMTYLRNLEKEKCGWYKRQVRLLDERMRELTEAPKGETASCSKPREIQMPTCQICRFEFDESPDRTPKLLECGHTLCRECAERIANCCTIKCPFDREEMYMDARRVAGLPNNYSIIEFLEMNKEK